MPDWDTPRERAVLDVAYMDSVRGPWFLDVAVLAAHSHRGVPAQTRLERHERKKHVRYPGPHLIPFVVDVRGRWGKEAQAWARAMILRLPSEDRALAMQELRWRISRALQIAVAEQCLRALRPTRRQPIPQPQGAAVPTPGDVGPTQGARAPMQVQVGRVAAPPTPQAGAVAPGAPSSGRAEADAGSRPPSVPASGLPGTPSGDAAPLPPSPPASGAGGSCL